ncbi:MAG TPA: AAA family ATPase [Actinoplanes sp.]
MEAPPRFGRTDELGVVSSFVDRSAADGAGLLLSGPPGVGKTLLLEAGIEAARATGMIVLTAGGVEFEADVAFATLNQLLMPLSDAFSRLTGTHRRALTAALGVSAGPPAGRATVAQAALELVRQTSVATPVLMVVDDLHWADRSSTAVLAAVAAGLRGSRVGLITASRSDGTRFPTLPHITELPVRPLSPEAAEALVTSRFPTLAPRVVQRVVHDAQGYPMALLELPSVLDEDQRSARTPLPSILPLTRRLQSLFGSRIIALPAPARQALLFAALDGSADLRALRSPTGEASRLDDLVPAEQARLVVIDRRTGRPVFRHPMIRATAVELSTDDERRHAHRDLARVTADQPERRAWHLADATVEADETVAGMLDKVAYRVLQRGDAVGAVTALLRAADLSERPTDRVRRLAEAAYIGADMSGDLRNVPHLLEAARAAGQGLGESLPAAVAAAYLLLNGEGDVATAHRLLAATISAHTMRYDTHDDVLIEALHNLLDVCFMGARPELWEPLDAALARLGPGIPVLLRLRVTVLADPARVSSSERELLDEVLAGLHEETDPVRILRIAGLASAVDRTGECRDALWTVIEGARGGGTTAPGITALLLLSIDDLINGAWAEADDLVAEGLGLCERLGYELLAWPFRWCTAWLAAVRGQQEVVARVTREITRWAEPRGVHAVEFYARHVRALNAIGNADFDDAYEQANAISPAGVLTPRVPHALGVVLETVESAERTNRHADAVAHVDALRKADVAALSPRHAFLVAGAAAIAAEDDQVIDMFTQALRLPAAGRLPFEAARLQLAYGERLRRMRMTARSRSHLAAALSTFHRLGAGPWTARANRELEATGQTRAHLGKPGLASSLTHREREVAMLAASGLTNKQIADRLFLSPRTVGSHLRQVFTKLAISTRAGLRNALDRPSSGTR